MKKNIIVFGATGRIGRELLIALSENRVPAIGITRNKSKAVLLPHIEWAEADMGNPESLRKVMTHGTIVFLLSSISNNFIAEQNNVIEVAKDLGIEHIVKLSSGVADARSEFLIPRVHGEIETLLQTSGVHFTILRSTGMMQNWLGELADTVKSECRFYESTGDGKRAYVDIQDIAEVAFVVLTHPQKYQNKTYLLTGGVAVNYFEIAESISSLVQKKVTYFPISLDEAKQQMEQQGMPVGFIKTFLAYDDAQANGETTFVSPHVREILNKQPRTVEDFVKKYIDRFR